ncbi:mechanosensitive ion channel family protein [Psychrosphaera algicola]
MYQEIKKTFDEQGIEIPFPHLSLYAGSETKPFDVDVKSTHPSSSQENK